MTGRPDIQEEEIKRMLISGDMKGMSVLYDKYAPVLYGIIFRIVQSEQLAEDVLKQSFIKIWKNFPSFSQQKLNLFTWLLLVCRETALEKTKTKEFAMTGKVHGMEKNIFEIDWEKRFDMSPELASIMETINKLSPEQKVLIEMVYYKGFTQIEVSEKLKHPLGTVKTRIRHAINILRREFESQGI